MVGVREIPRTAAFAWSPSTSRNLIATGTRAGAVDANFSDETRLEVWDLQLENRGSQELQPVATVQTDSRYYTQKGDVLVLPTANTRTAFMILHGDPRTKLFHTAYLRVRSRMDLSIFGMRRLYLMGTGISRVPYSAISRSSNIDRPICHELQSIRELSKLCNLTHLSLY